MKYIKTYFPVLLIFFFCCNSVEQKGLYSLDDSKEFAIANNGGKMAIVNGYKLDTVADKTIGDKSPMLYFLILVPPGYRAEPSVTDNQIYTSKLDYIWNGDNGKIEVIANVDRAKDEVNIRGQNFDRNYGNAFLVILNPQSYSIRQFKSLNSVDKDTVLNFFKVNGREFPQLQSAELDR